jgi:hypothetical protein
MTKPLPRFQSILVAVSHFATLLALGQIQRTLPVLSEKTPNDPAVVEFQDYHASTCEGGISLDEYGYESDSDLDEEEDTDETVQDSEWLHPSCHRTILG